VVAPFAPGSVGSIAREILCSDDAALLFHRSDERAADLAARELLDAALAKPFEGFGERRLAKPIGSEIGPKRWRRNKAIWQENAVGFRKLAHQARCAGHHR
jgi:hypothetical protein